MVGAQRSLDQDPRFGLLVLGEVASRALSPAINNPCTAIDVIGRAVHCRWTGATIRRTVCLDRANCVCAPMGKPLPALFRRFAGFALLIMPFHHFAAALSRFAFTARSAARIRPMWAGMSTKRGRE
ncbi:DUF2254 family protein [Stenotrophomonas sp. YIM B06876]|uniref:DUF2254 family protein n=1 Tax=Stenotrophomonas sp. YIM B06876 TaxID=3060211 RepID=UPI00273945C2|nr:DUF2254 family protein [Stenotrophomonas sp. YIM B06876]